MDTNVQQDLYPNQHLHRCFQTCQDRGAFFLIFSHHSVEEMESMALTKLATLQDT